MICVIRFAGYLELTRKLGREDHRCFRQALRREFLREWIGGLGMITLSRQAPPFVHLKIRKIWFRFGQKGLDPMLELGIGPQFLEGLAFQLEAHAQRSFIG